MTARQHGQYSWKWRTLQGVTQIYCARATTLHSPVTTAIAGSLRRSMRSSRKIGTRDDRVADPRRRDMLEGMYQQERVGSLRGALIVEVPREDLMENLAARCLEETGIALESALAVQRGRPAVVSSQNLRKRAQASGGLAPGKESAVSGLCSVACYAPAYELG